MTEVVMMEFIATVLKDATAASAGPAIGHVERPAKMMVTVTKEMIHAFVHVCNMWIAMTQCFATALKRA
jgi:hypothetical protein